MGIDYGLKRIGIALSDDGGTIAFPYKIIISSNKTLKDILEIIDSEQVKQVIVGKSLDQIGNRNSIMDDIDVFVEQLEKLTGITVILEDERFTSHFLKSFDFTKSIEKPITRDRNKKKTTEGIDAQAAAIILQRFLDKK
jgi:putative Holliday junction resolvase